MSYSSIPSSLTVASIYRNSGVVTGLSTFFAFIQMKYPLLGIPYDSNTLRVRILLFLEGIDQLKLGLDKKDNSLANSEKSKDGSVSGMAESGLTVCPQDLVFLFLLVLFSMVMALFSSLLFLPMIYSLCYSTIAISV